MTFRRGLVKGAIVGCLAMALLMFASTIWTTPLTGDVWRHLVDINHFSRRFLALTLVVVVWYLFKRRFAAWVMAVITLSVSLVLSVPHLGVLNLVLGGLQVFCLVVLLVSHRYFCRAADRPSVRRGLAIFVAMTVVVLGDAVVGRLLANPRISFWLSVQHVLAAVFVTGGVSLAARFMVVVFWASFAVGLLLVLRPAVFQAVTSPHLRARARELVLADGQNSLSYLALEDDKLLFFSEGAPGVVAYTITGDFVVVLGDPICAADDFPVVLREFYTFCAAGDYTVAFLGTTAAYLQQYAAMGFDWIKASEEACFDLTGFTLGGSARAKMRSKVNGATHSGVTVHEYRPLERRDRRIEHAFDAISTEWLRQKKTGELGFVVGGVNVREPLDRRYFYARDAAGEIVGFHVFLPYAGLTGYVVDVTRRRAGAPAGVTEKITAEAFLQFKAEGCTVASLGGAPLAHMGEADNPHPVADRALSLIYERGNGFYGFRDLRRSKNKYGPVWQPSYWVYPRGTLTPRMIMAVIKVQNPGGFADYLRGFLRRV